MQLLRSHLWVALFFCLISVGQAYPYSYGWSTSKESYCSCRREGHDCIHGCARKSLRVHSEENSKHKHHHSHGVSEPSGIKSADAVELQVAKISRRPCGARASQEILSFRGDPFLPSICSFPILPLRLQVLPEVVASIASVFFVPETPPPRQA